MISFPEEKLFYIKFKGHQLGPLPFCEIRKKYQRREIGGLHYLVTADEAIPLSRIFGSPRKRNAKSSLELAPRNGEATPAQEDPLPPRTSSPNRAHHWVWLNDRQQGPFTLQEIQVMLQAGKLNGRNLLWLEHSQSWRKIEDVLPTNTK
ncbi:MAG: DUF4339 domain-containing protein [Opitutales bacterium]|nr:DUF4339 domain-containing protein [Opitutales bacterium]MCH8540490.1 DUF4339 domain-containing protein [Opitutales bacterium]